MWWMGFTHFFDTQPFSQVPTGEQRTKPKPDGYELRVTFVHLWGKAGGEET